MRKVLLVASVFVVLAFSARADQARYFADLPDVPLAPGMAEIDAGQMVFETASARVVESIAAGRGVAGADVLSFYARTLPQLGWVPLGPARYQRGQEILAITAEDPPGPDLRIKVALSPKP